MYDDNHHHYSGAEQLEGAPFLLSKHFINVDNEDEGKICIGNAGGFETEVTLPCKMEIGPHGMHVNIMITDQAVLQLL